MISLETARQLKEAGLNWVPIMNDCFAIPGRGMDDRRFIISDILVTVEILGGMEVVSFQGASEWALDYLLTTEAVWLPSEEQLRQTLEHYLQDMGYAGYRLSHDQTEDQYEVTIDGGRLSFVASGASNAYASALFYCLTGK